MYRYIFDIGGVLISYDYKKVVEILAAQSGQEHGSIERLFKHDCLYRVETGRISCQEYYKSYVLKAMPGFTYDDWVQAFTEHYTVNPAGMELLMQLKREGKDVYILSNLAEFHKIAIERKVPGFFEICKKNFFSYELGYHKPESGIYREVSKSIGVEPEKCVFFDDISANVEGSIKYGMKGILFTNEEIDSIRQRICNSTF